MARIYEESLNSTCSLGVGVVVGVVVVVVKVIGPQGGAAPVHLEGSSIHDPPAT